MNYIGGKSLDAEIYVDFRKGEICMDYSSNSLHDPLDSNTSSVRNESNEWMTQPILIRYFWALTSLFGVLFEFVIALEIFVTTTLSRYNLMPKSWQYPYQQFLKWFYSNFKGVYEESFYGELSGTILQVLVDHNMWMEYELSGDYEKYIEKISFERRIRKFKRYNQYNQFVQDGWMLTFEFSKSPKVGSATVRYV